MSCLEGLIKQGCENHSFIVTPRKSDVGGRAHQHDHRPISSQHLYKSREVNAKSLLAIYFNYMVKFWVFSEPFRNASKLYLFVSLQWFVKVSLSFRKKERWLILKRIVDRTSKTACKALQLLQFHREATHEFLAFKCLFILVFCVTICSAVKQDLTSSGYSDSGACYATERFCPAFRGCLKCFMQGPQLRTFLSLVSSSPSVALSTYTRSTVI
jgi:hypothetical protein